MADIESGVCVVSEGTFAEADVVVEEVLRLEV